MYVDTVRLVFEWLNTEGGLDFCICILSFVWLETYKVNEQLESSKDILRSIIAFVAQLTVFKKDY